MQCVVSPRFGDSGESTEVKCVGCTFIDPESVWDAVVPVGVSEGVLTGTDGCGRNSAARQAGACCGGMTTECDLDLRQVEVLPLSAVPPTSAPLHLPTSNYVAIQSYCYGGYDGSGTAVAQ